MFQCMKVIIAGCHEVWTTQECARLVARAMATFGFHGAQPCEDCGGDTRAGVLPCTHSIEVSEVVHGGAKGIDAAADDWAVVHWVPAKVFPADWKKHGKAAGPIRNAEMADYGDALVAVWDGRTPGTRDMIRQMQRRRKPAYVLVTPART